jgi:hypothetical protein
VRVVVDDTMIKDEVLLLAAHATGVSNPNTQFESHVVVEVVCVACARTFETDPTRNTSARVISIPR